MSKSRYKFKFFLILFSSCLFGLFYFRHEIKGIIEKMTNNRCGIEKGQTQEVLPIFKKSIDQLQVKVKDDYLQRNVENKDVLLQLISDLKLDIKNVYHISLPEKDISLDLKDFTICIDSYFTKEKEMRIKEAEQTNGSIKKILLDVIKKIDTNTEKFQKFKGIKQAIDIEFQKIEEKLSEYESYLKSTEITNAVLESTHVEMKEDLKKILEIKTTDLDINADIFE